MKMRTSHLFDFLVVTLLLLIASSSADVEEEAEDAPQVKEIRPHPDLPDFQEGVSVRVLDRLDSCARVAVSGNWLELHFVAKQLNDEGETYDEFDSTEARQRPLLLAVDDKEKLPGLTEGLREVCVGEKREITIEAYSPLMQVDPKSGLIQPQTDRPVVYEVMVQSILDHKPVNLFAKMDLDSNNELSREEIKEYFGPDHDIDTFFNFQDKDQNDAISYQEFKGPKYNHDEF